MFVFSIVPFDGARHSLFLKSILDFFIKDQNKVIILLNNFETMFSIAIAFIFALIIFFLNKKEKIKKKYGIKGGDSSDIAMKNNIEKLFNRQNK